MTENRVAIDMIVAKIRMYVLQLRHDDFPDAGDDRERASDAMWALGHIHGLADAARAMGADAARIDAAMGEYV